MKQKLFYKEKNDAIKILEIIQEGRGVNFINGMGQLSDSGSTESNWIKIEKYFIVLYATEIKILLSISQSKISNQLPTLQAKKPIENLTGLFML